jgi:hypothetical protein
MTRPCCFHTMIQLFAFFSYTAEMHSLIALADFCTVRKQISFRSSPQPRRQCYSMEIYSIFCFIFLFRRENNFKANVCEHHIRHLHARFIVKEAAAVHVRSCSMREVRARNSRLDCTRRSRLYFDRLCPRCTADKNRPHTHLPPALSDAQNKLSRVHPPASIGVPFRHAAHQHFSLTLKTCSNKSTRLLHTSLIIQIEPEEFFHAGNFFLNIARCP